MMLPVVLGSCDYQEVVMMMMLPVVLGSCDYQEGGNDNGDGSHGDDNCVAI